MSLVLRLRHPQGVATLNLLSDATVGDLREQVSSLAGCTAAEQRFKLGFPPKSWNPPGNGHLLRDCGIQNGESLVLELAPGWPQLAVSSSNNSGAKRSMNEVGRLLDGRQVVRRVIASDNNCLFNAVGYNMEHSRTQAFRLRRVVANRVAQDPLQFNEGFLEKPNVEYQQWILNPEKWGGPIELYILAMYFNCEIAAFDIQTGRCDVYGRDKGYSQRCLLLYDGLHYDALALQAFPDAPEAVDCTLFDTAAEDLPQVMEAAESLVRDFQRKKKFTNTTTFALQCAVCYQALVGAEEARTHAKETGHQNFQEYNG